LTFLIGATFASAQAIPPLGWVTTDDYPDVAIRRGREGTTGYRLSIGTDGKPFRCDITAASGTAEIDAATCRAVMKRARFEPARDVDGTPLIAVYRASVNFSIPGRRPAPLFVPADIVVNVERLPAGIESPFVVSVALLVDREGRILACEPASATPAQFKRVACQQAAALSTQAATDPSGAPAKSVQGLAVTFVTPRPAK
jgi:TonB family protein